MTQATNRLTKLLPIKFQPIDWSINQLIIAALVSSKRKTCSIYLCSISRYHGAWHSSMTGSWLPGTTAGRPASRPKWLATESASPWTTAQAPSPSPRWDQLTTWPTSTLSPPRSLSRCAWALDSTKQSSTAASLSSKSEEKRERRTEKISLMVTVLVKLRQKAMPRQSGVDLHDPVMKVFPQGPLMFLSPQISG